MPRSSIRRLRAAMLITLVALATSITPATAGGGPVTHWVDHDGQAGPDGCGGTAAAPTSIQDAVDAAGDGDIILVCPGEYVGTVSITEADDLTIRGVEPWTADLIAPATDVLIRVEDVSGTRIQWLELLAPTEGECAFVGALISISGAPDTAIRANHLGALGTATNGPCGFSFGIQLSDFSHRSVIAWNRVIDFRGAGISAGGGSMDVDIHGNSARYLHAAAVAMRFPVGTGIRVESTSSARVVGNVVRSLPSAGVTTPVLAIGIEARYSDDVGVVDNRVFHAYTGLWFTSVEGTVARGNTVRQPRGVGLSVDSTDGARIVKNVVRGGAGAGADVDSRSTGNVLRGNDFRDHVGLDCQDHTGPTVQNTWVANLGFDSSPEGICTAP